MKVTSCEHFYTASCWTHISANQEQSMKQPTVPSRLLGITLWSPYDTTLPLSRQPDAYIGQYEHIAYGKLTVRILRLDNSNWTTGKDTGLSTLIQSRIDLTERRSASCINFGTVRKFSSGSIQIQLARWQSQVLRPKIRRCFISSPQRPLAQNQSLLADGHVITRLICLKNKPIS